MKTNPNVNLINGVKIILFQLGNLKKSESLCIISDINTKNLGELFEYVSRKMKIKTTHILELAHKSIIRAFDNCYDRRDYTAARREPL